MSLFEEEEEEAEEEGRFFLRAVHPLFFGGITERKR